MTLLYICCSTPHHSTFTRPPHRISFAWHRESGIMEGLLGPIPQQPHKAGRAGWARAGYGWAGPCWGVQAAAKQGVAPSRWVRLIEVQGHGMAGTQLRQGMTFREYPPCLPWCPPQVARRPVWIAAPAWPSLLGNLCSSTTSSPLSLTLVVTGLFLTLFSSLLTVWPALFCPLP